MKLGFIISTIPSLAEFNDLLYMAWKGGDKPNLIENDQGIYWTVTGHWRWLQLHLLL